MRTTIFETPRLRLCVPISDDFEPLFERVLSDPMVMQHVFSGGPMPRAEAERLFADQFDHGGTGRKLAVLVRKDDPDPIGFSGLVACTVLGEDDLELGFVLSRAAWGQGFAQEIGRGQLDFGFRRLGYPRLLAQVAPQNAASIASLEKIGMRRHSLVQTADRGARLVFVAEPGAHQGQG